MYCFKYEFGLLWFAEKKKSIAIAALVKKGQKSQVKLGPLKYIKSNVYVDFNDAQSYRYQVLFTKSLCSGIVIQSIPEVYKAKLPCLQRCEAVGLYFAGQTTAKPWWGLQQMGP